MKLNRVQMLGMLLLVGGLVSLVGINLAQLVYPGYSVRDNFVSDLGATCQHDPVTYWPYGCVYMQPASTIFSVSTDALGLMVLAAVSLMYPLGGTRRLSILLGLAGVGAFGAGLVSEQYAPYHSIFALMAFFPGSLAALESFRFLPRLLGYVSLALGGISLAATLIHASVGGELGKPIWIPLGIGGMELMIVYPVLLWVTLFGAEVAALPNSFSGPVDRTSGASAPAEAIPTGAPVPGRSAKPPV